MVSGGDVEVEVASPALATQQSGLLKMEGVDIVAQERLSYFSFT